ncbi:MAG TPA: cytochrome c oxidase subunit II [Rudaea sp.]|jgi:cytochrome c oxidase subunit 2|nr:cytochrome c oxidase subunit II [Rudaea sp.]
MVANAAHALAEPWQLNMTQGVTETSREVYAMHMWAFWVCVAIGIVVFGAMIWSMIFHRKSRGAVAARWSHNTRVEAIWTVVPIIILVSLAWPATNVLLKMAYTEKSDMTIKVTGYQWKWGYDYINVGDKPYHVHFISRLDPQSDKTRELKSGMDPWAVKQGNEQTYLLDVDKPLIIPADTKVRFVVTGDDVIHAWWVPQLGWKQDAIPGIINDAWTEVHDPGVYRGQCAELCGQDHGFMPIVVKVVSKADFQTWIDQQEAAMHPATPTPAAPAATAPTPAAPTQS